MTEFGALETLSDVMSLLQSAECQRNGLAEKVLRRNGIGSIEVAVTALRTRGYEVEVFRDDEGGKRLRLLATPVVGARERAKQQTALFRLPPTTRGPYDEAA